MSIDYKIKAYPTKYCGITYRSRLEARWAAFFDQLKWSHVYEPYDMGAWSPDFLINGSVLVEVKPITEPDDNTIKKIQIACTERGVWDEDSELRGALLLGISPIPRPPFPLLFAPLAGWFIGRHGVNAVDIRWYLDPSADTPLPVAELFHREDHGWFSVFSGDFGFDWNNGSRALSQHTMGLWGRAIAEVQYKAPR